MNKISNKISKESLFYLILFINIAILLITLSNSYTDGYNLRQSQTAILAKNIYYDNFNIFPTRLSIFAPQKGEIIFEFPFVHFLTALTYKFSPISEINGRLINLLFYIFNGILFFKIQRLIFKGNLSIIISILFISSPKILYLAHAFMPETSMMFFYLLTYYFFIKNKIKYNHINEKLMFIFLAITPILKPPAGVIFFPIFLDYLKEFKFNYIIRKSIPFFISALPFLLWMYYGTVINNSDSASSEWSWNSVLISGYLIEYWFNFSFYLKIISNFLIQHLNPITFILSIYAVIINFKSKDPLIKFHLNWIFGNLLFLFLLPEINLGHPYYQIIFIPSLLFFTGLGIQKIKAFFPYKDLFIYSLVLINLISSIAIYVYGSNENLRISNLDEFKNVLAENVIIKKDIPSEYILYSHKGMAYTAVYPYYSDSYSRQFNLESENISDLKERINSGAKYIFFLNSSYGNTIKQLKNNIDIFNWLNSEQNKLYESKNIILYKLNSVSK